MTVGADAAAASQLPPGHEVHSAPGYLIRPRPPAEVGSMSLLPPCRVPVKSEIPRGRPGLPQAVPTNTMSLAASADASAT